MLWDLNEGKHLYTLDGGDIINALTFSPNRYWLCAATGQSIKIWVWSVLAFGKGFPFWDVYKVKLGSNCEFVFLMGMFVCKYVALFHTDYYHIYYLRCCRISRERLSLMSCVPRWLAPACTPNRRVASRSPGQPTDRHCLLATPTRSFVSGRCPWLRDKISTPMSYRLMCVKHYK